MLDGLLHVGAVLALLSLGLVARAIGGRWIYPPAVFAFSWSFCLGAGLVLRFGGLRFSADALLVFVLGGALAVISGSLVTVILRRPVHATSADSAPDVATAVRLVIALSGVVLFSLVPRFIGELQAAASTLGIDDLATGARTALSLNLELVPRSFATAASLGTTLAYFAAAIYDGRARDRILLLLSVAAPLALLVPTFARTPLVVLTVGVLGILAVRRRVPVFAVVIAIAVVVAGATAMGAALGKGPDSAGGSGLEAFARNLGTYFVGGPLGFSEIMANPNSVGEHGLGWRFFTQPLQSVGLISTIPDNVLGELRFELGNVYTMYYAYWLDFGWAGVALVSVCAGAVSAALYEGALRGSLFCLTGLGIVYPSFLNVGTGDGLFATAMPWILLGMFTVALTVGGRALGRVRPAIAMLASPGSARAP